MNDMQRNTNRSKLINHLLSPTHEDTTDAPGVLRPDVVFGLQITDSRLDDEQSVATITFSDTPAWLLRLLRDPHGFPKTTDFGTLWKAVDANSADADGRTAFTRAIIAGKLLYAEMMAEFETTDINIADNQGRTALHWACVMGLPVMVKLCLSVPECVVGLRDTDDRTALDLARRAGNQELGNLFYQSMFELEERDPQAALLRVLTVTSDRAVDKAVFPGEAIFEPIEGGNSRLVAALVDRGVDLTTRNERGDTALHLAAAKPGNIQMVARLMGAGADVNAIGFEGSTPLHCATRTADKEVVEVLLAGQADPELKDCNDRSPLHWAAEVGKIDVVQLLLFHGAEVEAKDAKGQTACQLAEVTRRADIVEILRPANDEQVSCQTCIRLKTEKLLT